MAKILKKDRSKPFFVYIFHRLAQAEKNVNKWISSDPYYEFSRDGCHKNFIHEQKTSLGFWCDRYIYHLLALKNR